VRARIAGALLVGTLVIAAGAGRVLAGGEPAPSGPLAACVKAASDRLQAHYDHVQDLEARFVQETHSVAFAGGAGGEQRASGSVVFAKPGRMRWTYREPEPSLVVSDGKTLWLFDEGAREVQVMQVSGGFLSGVALQFLFGKGRIEKSFRVEPLQCSAVEARLRLLPRADASYESLELRVDAVTGQVEETSVVDLFGNRTQIRFEDVRENQAPAAALFHFEPPEGVRVTQIAPPHPSPAR